jgi:hypothetical protein
MTSPTIALTNDEETSLKECPSFLGAAWDQMLLHIPGDLERMAQQTQALQRRREVKSAGDLLRLVLAYSVCHWSLRLVGLWATVIGLGELSDVAVRKRLCHTQAWLGQVVTEWLGLRRERVAAPAVRLRLRDATTVSVPGSLGTDGRLHAVFDVGAWCLVGVEVTDGRGSESLLRESAQAQEIDVADQGYNRREELGKVLEARGRIILRLNPQHLQLETAAGTRWDWVPWLEQAQFSIEPLEVTVWMSSEAGRFELRVVAHHLPPALAAAARRRVQRAAQKDGRTPKAETLLAAEFVLLLTNLLSVRDWPAATLLAVYRLRWQIELVFKRWKSLLGLAEVRATDPVLVQVYLLGQIVGALLVEESTAQLVAQCPTWRQDAARPFSDWRWTRLAGDLLCQTIRGALTSTRVWGALPRLARYLCNSPRKRLQQSAVSRQWLAQLGIGIAPLAPLLNAKLEATC